MFTIEKHLFNLGGTIDSVVFGACVVIFLVSGSFYLLTLKTQLPFPPGPKGSPIIGNLRQVPAERSDVQFAQWAKEYKSDIIYLNLMGQPVIVLNSVKSATDLLDKRGAIYSDRPQFVTLEALGFNDNLAITGDGAQFRKIRKEYGSFLSVSNSLAYQADQLKHARRMAVEIENSPGKWPQYLALFATRVIFSMAFAIDVVDENEDYCKLAERMGWIVSNMGTNGITALDIAPWIQHIPRWVGKYISSVKFVHDHTPTISEFHQRPFDEVMAKFNLGKLEPSFIGRLLTAREARKGDPKEAIKSFTDSEIKGTGGSLYSAGQDTTYSSETIFVMAMVMNPEVQERAQKEIDAVTGATRLPVFEDRKNLPIIDRIVSEVFRFHPPVPNGVPHRTTQEDIYRGMLIPKVANIWAMMHDPEIYTNPSTFNPDRFLSISQGGLEEPITKSHFGFGRRVCPGQHLGVASVWIVVATLLAKFDIAAPKDADGRDILPVMEFSTGITSHAVPFTAIFTARNSL